MTTRLPFAAAASAAALAAALTGCGDDSQPAARPSGPASSKPAPLPLLVRGTFTLGRPNFVWSDTTHVCAGQNAHDDIHAGTQVIVTDPAGVSLAVGALDAGQPVMDTTDPTRAASCLFAFKISDVPSGKGIYGVEIAHRGKVQFPEAKLSQSISLGLT